MTRAAQLAGLGSLEGSAPAYACRAWVNFNGTGTVAIRASGNVSSITDNGTGNYTVNFNNSMPDANYCAELTSNAAVTNLGGFTRTSTFSTGGLVVLHYENGNLTDTDYICVAIFR